MKFSPDQLPRNAFPVFNFNPLGGGASETFPAYFF